MPGKFDYGVISQIQQANDIVDVISEHVSLSKKGREMVGLCPFHDDHRPSMYVNVTKQIFKCFACSAGGDVVKFIQMRENLTFPQALERLAERAGIKLKPAEYPKSQTQDKSEEMDPNMLAKVNEWAAKYFQQNLCDQQKGKAARDYVAGRQIKPDIMKKWRLGLAVDSGDDLVKAAKARDIPVKLLSQAGLVVGRTDSTILSDKFVNRLMFTITDVTGRVIGFGGRTLDETGAKYINSPTTILFDKSNSLYGLEQARHRIVSAGSAVVVEGYTDCIMAHQCGCDNVVATLGTSFTTGHARMLRRYAEKVVLIFDSDIAGLEAANRALEVCLAQRIDIKLASVPQGKDPCDFLLAAGREMFEELVDKAVDVFQYKWNRLTESLSSDDILAGKKKAIDEYLNTIATAMWSGNLAAIDRGLIVNRLSKIIGVDASQINAELSKRTSRAATTASYDVKNQKVASIDLGQGLFAKAQREILEVLLNEPKLFKIVKDKIRPDLFDVPVLRQMAAILFETLSSEPEASLAAILAKTESVEGGKCFVELADAGQKKGNFKARLTGAIDAIQQCRAQMEKREIREVKDKNQFLRSVCESVEKENRRNVGMV